MSVKLIVLFSLTMPSVLSYFDFDSGEDDEYAINHFEGPQGIILHSNPRFSVSENFETSFNDGQNYPVSSFPVNEFHLISNNGGSSSYGHYVQQTNHQFNPNNFLRGANYFMRPSFQSNLPITENSVSGICGVSIYELITGGENVQQGEYPWLASLFEDSSYICTASLVTASHLVTAAHCVRDYVDPFYYSVVLGVTNPRQDNLRYISKILIHPDYVKSYAAHDVAILTLYTSVAFSNTIKPICLWQMQMTTNERNGVVAGFGPDYKQCRKIQYPIVSQNTCLESNRHFKSLISDDTFCAGTRNGQGPCLGDSGSGFMQFLGGRFYLRGVVSQSLNANNNCNLREYIIFSDLATETNWLHRELDPYIN